MSIRLRRRILLLEKYEHNIVKIKSGYIPCCVFSQGDYEVSIKFNDEHIPDSPFIVPIATLSDDARRLTITSLQVRKKSTASLKSDETVYREPA